MFLCTGNICRSPAAEGLLRHRLAAAGIDAHVHSAGSSMPDRPATEEGVRILAGRGIDTSAHRSRTVTADLVIGADLVLGLARRHVREAAVQFPGAWPRIFTLKELVRRGGQAGARAPEQPLQEWLDKVGAGRRPTDLMGSDPDDDVADPIGQGLAEYERMIAEVDGLVSRLAHLVWGI